MNINKDLLDLMQEGVQVWDVKGKRLFNNSQALVLHGVDAEEMQTLDDITSKWTFYDDDGKLLRPIELPATKVLHTKEPLNDIVLKMTSQETTRWIVQNVTPLFDGKGELEGVISTCVDITHLKSQETKYKNIANYDPLTHLPNRLLLSDRLAFSLLRANRNKDKVAVCMIDLDGFKAVNDTLGHDAGDVLLIEVARRMQKVIRPYDTVARLGGDEFVVILADIAKIDDCAIVLYRVLNILALPYMIDEHEVKGISASIGVSVYPDDKVEPDILLRHADVAMYQAKNSGKNRFTFFDVASDQKIRANHKTLERIKKAITQGDFCFYYQPKINTFTEKVIEVEALARWAHPFLGLLSPNEFMPLIENDEKLNKIFDEWAIKEGIRQLDVWKKEGLSIEICINISPRQLDQKDFVSTIKQIVSQEDIDIALLAYLEFEILDTSSLEQLNNVQEVISQCKELGITFALGHFGTEESSLTAIREYPIDTIKIDKNLVMRMLDDTAEMPIVQTVTGLASAFDISATAVGAESMEQVLSLIEIGYDEIQGYAIARPMPSDAMRDFIIGFTPDPRWRLASKTLPSRTDFDLLLAEADHKYWVQSVIGGLSRDGLSDDVLQVTHKECRFGRWFEGFKDQMTPDLRDLDHLHRQIHDKVHRLYETLKKEKRVINSAEEIELLQMSDELTILLAKIKKRYKDEKKHLNLVNKILDKREHHGR